MPRYLLLLLAALVLTLAVPAAPRGAAATPYIFQTDMYGANNVPPVQTVAWGFLRFYFSDNRMSADYTVDVKGYSGSLVTGADIRRGAPGTNGPVIRHLADGGFITFGGKITFTEADLRDMGSGQWYVSLRTTLNPDGDLRGQIILPPDFFPAQTPAQTAPVPEVVAPPAGAVDVDASGAPAPARPPASAPSFNVTPPNTGDAGLR